jgi:hypothetical protein
MAAITLGRPINARVTGPRGFGRATASRLGKTSVSVIGHLKIIEKLNNQKFWVVPTKETMLSLQNYSFNLAKKRSPRLTGDAKGKITKSTDKAITPKFADVILKPSLAKSDGTFRYSFALDAARRRAPKGMSGKGEFARVRRTKLTKTKRIRVTNKNAPYKYRSTSFKGQKTFNWFHGTSKLTAKQLRTDVMQMAREIQSAWSA